MITKEHRTVKLSEIIPYANNPRKNDQAVPVVEASIERFTYTTEIEVDESMVILAGHTRYKALRKMGVEECEVMIIRGMTNEEKVAYRLAHNKTGEVAEWDEELLVEELDDIEEIPMETLGFADRTIDLGDPDPGEVAEVEVPEPPRVAKSKRGEFYILGRHRLMCGDATSEEDMDRLMDGAKADIAFTSPPYNAGKLEVTIDGKTNKNTEQKYINDEDQRSETEYVDFLDTNLNILMDRSKYVFYNIGVISGSKKAIIELLHRNKDHFKDFIYWEKNNPVYTIAKGVISSAIELIMAFGKNDGSRAFGRDIGYYKGVIHGNTASDNQFADIHKATFPVYLPSEIISTFTERGGGVLDCFGGTGTTMIACEQMDRTCYMMELEPIYVDVIIERWEKLTGCKAEKVSG